MDSHKRTLVKTITWRTSGIILSIALVWLITGDINLGVELGLGYNIIRAIQYYISERIWNKVKWGQNKKEKREL